MHKDPIIVYGTKWCIDCFRAKRILDNNQIEYLWININQDKGAKEFVGQVNDGDLVVPTIVFANGSILSEPSNQELKRKLGLDSGSSI